MVTRRRVGGRRCLGGDGESMKKPFCLLTFCVMDSFSVRLLPWGAEKVRGPASGRVRNGEICRTAFLLGRSRSPVVQWRNTANRNTNKGGLLTAEPPDAATSRQQLLSPLDQYTELS